MFERVPNYVQAKLFFRFHWGKFVSGKCPMAIGELSQRVRDAIKNMVRVIYLSIYPPNVSVSSMSLAKQLPAQGSSARSLGAVKCRHAFHQLPLRSVQSAPRLLTVRARSGSEPPKESQQVHLLALPTSVFAPITIAALSDNNSTASSFLPDLRLI